jgi:Zn-dependent metalloprotease
MSSPTGFSCEFDVIRGFEVFLFTAIPFLIKREIIHDFVKTANPKKTKAFHTKLTDLIRDYSRTFIKVGEKSLSSLERIPTEMEMGAIFNTVRVVAKNDKYYEAFKKNIHLVHDMITNPIIQKDIKEQHIIDNGNAIKMYYEIMDYLRTSNPTETFVAKYSPDGKKVKFVGMSGEPESLLKKRGRPKKA